MASTSTRRPGAARTALTIRSVAERLVKAHPRLDAAVVHGAVRTAYDELPASLDRWDAYTTTKVEMFRTTDTAHAPWTVVKSNDKRRARLEAMRSLLWRIDYTNKDEAAVGHPDPLIAGAADTLLEAGEAPADLSSTPLTGLTVGPGHHPPTSPQEGAP